LRGTDPDTGLSILYVTHTARGTTTLELRPQPVFTTAEMEAAQVPAEVQAAVADRAQAADDLGRANEAIRDAGGPSTDAPATSLLAVKNDWMMVLSTEPDIGVTAAYITHTVGGKTTLVLGPDSEPRVSGMTAAGVPIEIQAFATCLSTSEVRAEQQHPSDAESQLGDSPQ